MSVGLWSTALHWRRRAMEIGSSVGGGPSGCPDVQLLLISKDVGGEEGGEEVGLVGEE